VGETLTTVRVGTAIEMEAAVLEAYAATHAVVATAAVSDFRPAAVAEQKVKKDDAPATIDLERNPDILARLGRDKGDRVLVGFAAETEALIENAREKLGSKHLDLVVANDVSVAGQGFGADVNGVVFVDAEGDEDLGVVTKSELAARLLDRVGILLGD
jgi:phosphopantothenoylcysteine decarboxylase/phosphopantothenate--cysteine ligase